MVILNRYPYNTGHVMVAPRMHVGSPGQLEDIAARALDALLRVAIRGVQQTYAPHGLNVGMNVGRSAGAGVPDHCHWHIVPRWEGDTNFMPVLGQTKVLSESLEDSFTRLKPCF